MKNFRLEKANSVEEAVRLIKSCEGKACIKAGGTDILGGLKREIHPEYTQLVVDILDLDELSYIREEDGFIKIGALTRLKAIAGHELLRKHYTVLAEAARRTASPNLRSMGTIGGNICQENRCWYYRARDNFFPCKMKGGKRCYAPTGDNRIHSVLGAVNACFAVNPSDTAPALLALGAQMVSTERVIDSNDFWTAGCSGCTILNKGEIVKEIRFKTAEGMRSAFLKHALRPTIDFPILNCAVVNRNGEIKIALNGVYPTPYRPLEAEQLVSGTEMTEELAAKAAELAFAKARALSGNGHKIQIAKAYIKTLLMETGR